MGRLSPTSIGRQGHGHAKNLLHRRNRPNRFADAVYFGRSKEFHYAEKAEQEMAEGCNRLIRNAIIRWNYPYLSAATPVTVYVLLLFIALLISRMMNYQTIQRSVFGVG
jgi:hypothetical protein